MYSCKARCSAHFDTSSVALRCLVLKQVKVEFQKLRKPLFKPEMLAHVCSALQRVYCIKVSHTDVFAFDDRIT